MKKIVIIPDSFKGSASSIEVCNLIEKGVLKIFKDSKIKKIPVADGGEGTVDAIVYATGGNIKTIKSHDPLGRIVDAKYAFIDEKRAVIEMAATSGLPLLTNEERNPLLASTFGTGEIILDAIENGAKEILIGIGGSATNDCGVGMAEALGYRFLDKNGNTLKVCGGNMIDIKKIDNSKVDKRISGVNIIAACDVVNPLYGKDGATAIYGPQKGVTPEMFDILDNGLKNVAMLIKETVGIEVDNIQGSGAAGGLGAGLIGFCGGKLKSGIEAVLDIVNFDNEIKDASLIITGEGAIDGQTKKGKVPMGVALRAKKQGVPVIAIVGDIRDGAEAVYDLGIISIMPALKRAMPLEEAIKNSHSLILDAAERVCRFISIKI